MSIEDILGPRKHAAIRKRLETNMRIGDAARTLFDRYEYRDVRYRMVAATSGVSTSTVYDHFPTKRSLAVAAHASDILRLIDSAEEALDNNEAPTGILEVFIDQLADYLASHPAMAYALLPLSQDARVADDEPSLIVSLDDITLLLVRMLGPHQHRDGVEFALFGMLTWIVHHQDHSHCSAMAASLMHMRLL